MTMQERPATPRVRSYGANIVLSKRSIELGSIRSIPGPVDDDASVAGRPFENSITIVLY